MRGDVTGRRDRRGNRGAAPYSSLPTPGQIRVRRGWSEGLLTAAEDGDLDQVREMLAKGVSPNTCVNGRYALHRAVVRGHLEVVQYLIEHGGADPLCRTSRGWTLLHQAAAGGSETIAQYLLRRGSEVDARTSVGHTPLHTAARHGSVAVAQLLIQHGADVIALTYNGWLPLHHAAKEGFIEFAQVLLANGSADVQTLQLKTKKGWTALEHATNRGHAELGQILLKAGAALEVDGGAAEKSDLDDLIGAFKV